MRVSLVTGAAGFVGANLVRRLLRDGDHVVAGVRPGGDRWRLAAVRHELELADADLRDAEAAGALVRRHRPARVFHLAAHGGYSWQEDVAALVTA